MSLNILAFQGTSFSELAGVINRRKKIGSEASLTLQTGKEVKGVIEGVTDGAIQLRIDGNISSFTQEEILSWKVAYDTTFRK